MKEGFDVDLVLERRSRQGDTFALEAAFSTGPGLTVAFGPSGSGKTTLLLAILGALRGGKGRVRVGGRTLLDSAGRVDLPVHRRRIGIVFQDALLFPHLDVLSNVAFGMRGASRAERRVAARLALEHLGADELADRYPAELSGGQRQRVALARALAAKPFALLLDEPFSALDAASRESLGDALVRLQEDTGVPFLHVTHDLAEAVRLGHELVVLDRGRVAQTGTPAEIAAAPASAAAARAIGTENLFTGTVTGRFSDEGFSQVDLGGTRVDTGLLDLPKGTRVALGLRAEDVLLSVEPIRATSARNVIAGTVREVGRRGSAIRVDVTTPVLFRVVVTPASLRELDLRPGRRVHLLIKAHAFHRLV